MKVLVIPDIHLKPEMFQQAAKLMKSEKVEQAVCLMDLADDWGKEFDIMLYEKTYDAAIAFADEFPNTLWCYGNHDLSYQWHQLESGYSAMASYTVQKKLIDLKEAVPENALKYVHKIDNVLFSHGGVSDHFVKSKVLKSQYDDADKVIDLINGLGRTDMWDNGSPIWLRPQKEYSGATMYQSTHLLQVVGHTPMKQITREQNLISCDVFSTYPDGRPVGTAEFLLLDTESWEFHGAKTPEPA